MNNPEAQAIANDPRLARIIEASQAGDKWAKDLKPGDVFLGASPAAIAAGYENDSPAHRMFIFFALEILEKRNVITTPENQIISIHPKGTR